METAFQKEYPVATEVTPEQIAAAKQGSEAVLQKTRDDEAAFSADIAELASLMERLAAEAKDTTSNITTETREDFEKIDVL